MPHVDKFIDGKRVPSVTEVLSVIGKPHLYRWFAKYGWQECERVKKESGVFGSIVHDRIEALLRGDNSGGPANPPRAEDLAQLAIRWAKESKFTWVELECHVTDTDEFYQGTFDAIGYFGKNSKELFVMDWKTSGSIDHVNYPLQLAAYAHGWNKACKKQVVNNGGILRLAKDPGAKVQVETATFNNLEEQYYPVFKAALEIHKYIEAVGGH